MSTPALRILSAADAQRLTQRIKLTASGVRDGLFKLRNLLEEARSSNTWQVLGYPSWTAYLADTLADEPMRLGREERLEIVGYLAGEGLSGRAIAPIVGVDRKTVDRDIARGANVPPVFDVAPAPAAPTEPEHPEPADVTITDAGRIEVGHLIVVDESADTGVAVEDDTVVSEWTPRVVEASTRESAAPTPVTGLDGKTYTRPAGTAPKRRSLVDDAFTANRELFRAIEAIRTIRNDDRYTRNKADILAALQPSADLAIEILADLFNTTPIKEN